MTDSQPLEAKGLLILAAGAKGAIGSTLAAMAAVLGKDSERIRSSLTTGDLSCSRLPVDAVRFAGWDVRPDSLCDCLQEHGVLPQEVWRPYAEDLRQMPLLPAPSSMREVEAQADHLAADIARLRERHPGTAAVLMNLLPAAAAPDLEQCTSLAEACRQVDPALFPDIAYALAAVRCGVPFVNFTPNAVEFPALAEAASASRVPICGRDGKTGQTYFKIVLASAFKARSLRVDGWYSLNILGNADGRNLMDPERARGKLANKTDLLDPILGYPVGERYGKSTHQVRIDYYPPRGDAKEAWDVIDFMGVFGLPMSLRINLQGRDSVLAAPMAMDLARWMALLHMTGRKGPVPDLGFYFKKPMGENPPLTFQEQVAALGRLRIECGSRME